MAHADRLEQLVRESPVLMRALRAVEDVDPPDWLVCAGAIRDLVWDALHDRRPAIPRDVDVGFFDSKDLARDAAVTAALRDRAPDLPWDAKNQAAVHLWYPERFGVAVEPFHETAEAIATFPETASCVGVRLHGDELHVVAPYGLDDLFGLVCRHNPARVPASFYTQRVDEKRWRARWPGLTVVDA